MTDHICSKGEITANVRRLLKKYHADHAILFGSYAREQAESQSDIDLLVVGGEQFEPTNIFCIADDLYRALGKDVDVYELREINRDTDFYRSIFSEGEAI